MENTISAVAAEIVFSMRGAIRAAEIVKSLRTNRAAHGKHNLCRDGLPSQQLSNEGNQSTLLIECFIHLPKACRLRLPSKTICPCSRKTHNPKPSGPSSPIYQALTHLERYHSLICKM